MEFLTGYEHGLLWEAATCSADLADVNECWIKHWKKGLSQEQEPHGYFPNMKTQRRTVEIPSLIFASTTYWLVWSHLYVSLKV